VKVYDMPSMVQKSWEHMQEIEDALRRGAKVCYVSSEPDFSWRYDYLERRAIRDRQKGFE
jgi:hypothetical protein